MALFCAEGISQAETPAIPFGAANEPSCLARRDACGLGIRMKIIWYRPGGKDWYISRRYGKLEVTVHV